MSRFVKQDAIVFLKSLLAPRALMCGVLGAFLACCVIGHAVSKQNQYENFERFNAYLNNLSLYYPTASQTVAIANDAMAEGKILVIVGGNSIMYGLSQTREFVWMRQMQAQLGDRYRVLNYSLPGSNPVEVGAIAAEIIARDYKKVILISQIWPGAAGSAGEPDGNTQAYFFWDAYFKELLTIYPPREMRLAVLAKIRKGDYPYAELKLRSRLDSAFFYQDLWTTFSYHRMGTVWCPLVSDSFLKARKEFTDVDSSIPMAQRYPVDQDEQWMAMARAGLGRYWGAQTAGAVPLDYASSPLTQSIVTSMPPHIRQRTLLCVPHLSPHYVDKLTTQEQAIYRDCFPQTINAIRAAGCRGVEIGRDYSPLDFNDLLHISVEGAGKMARDVAPHVRALAEQLDFDK
jgi:hypothetical protein